MQHLTCAVALLGVLLRCSLANQPIECPIIVRNMPVHEIVRILNDNLEMCSLSHYNEENAEESVNSPDEETLRTNLRKFCNSTSMLEPCFALHTPYAEACLDQYQLLGYEVNRDNWRNGIHAICSDLGERMVLVRMKLSSFSDNSRKTCGQEFEFNDTVVVGPATRTLRLYRGMKSFRQCVMDLIGNGEENRSLSEVFTSLITDVLKEMKCVAADNETVQGCESLDNAAD